jgi:hypothetical protein
MRLAVCCAVVGICKDPICQVEPTPTASVQHAETARNAASHTNIHHDLCIRLHASKRNIKLYCCSQHIKAVNQPISSCLLPHCCWPDLTSSPHVIDSHAELYTRGRC